MKTSTRIKKITDAIVKKYGIPERNDATITPLDALIGTILSQNTNDKNSYRAYQTLKKNYKSWFELLEIPEQQLKNDIKVAGLTDQKSGAILGLLRYIREKKLSETLSELEQQSDDEILAEFTRLKGIGVKTVSCVLLFSLNRNVCPVDTHVHRIVNRMGLVKGSAPDKTFELLRAHIPADHAHTFHTNLLRLGREVCTPTAPACGSCVVSKYCEYEGKDITRKRESVVKDFFLLDSLY